MTKEKTEKTEKLTIGIVGLGLIGGSFAKAIKENTHHTVLGFDKYEEIIKKAHFAGAIDGSLSGRIPECDVLMLALYPLQATEFVRENAELINKKTIVIDCCGTKSYVCEHIGRLAEENGFTFIGGHPMAGTHNSGLKYSRADMFCGAPMVMVPPRFDDIVLLDRAKKLLSPMGFGTYSVTTAEDHDRMIAFTSQLAHVVSSAYIKSPTAAEHRGFSAGSYKDMTRVAWLNENMWGELFLENSEPLLYEIDRIINSLTEYKEAIANKDIERLTSLLRDGRIKKERIDG